MARYVLKFSKEGYIKYISHLDMLRLFKRAFKKTQLDLQYSHGFNPHPKMSFVQPLSLGYTSIGELLEFDMKIAAEPIKIQEKLQDVMPEGITITECNSLDEGEKTLASVCIAAEYIIAIPVKEGTVLTNVDSEKFLQQNEIICQKRQKKKKELKDVNIKPMIRELSLYTGDNKLFMSTTLDAGSSSNLSPELLIKAFMAWIGLPLERENVEILRKKIIL